MNNNNKNQPQNLHEVLKKVKIGFISLEMTKESIGNRFLSVWVNRGKIE